MIGGRPCSDCISFGRRATGLDGPGDGRLFFRLLLSIQAAKRDPRSHAFMSWRAAGAEHPSKLRFKVPVEHLGAQRREMVVVAVVDAGGTERRAGGAVAEHVGRID